MLSVVLMTLAALPAGASAQPWSVTGQLLAMSSPSLPDIALGGQLEGRYALSPRLHLSARIGGTDATHVNSAWIIDQRYVLALAGGGVGGTLGRARFSADLQVGGLLALQQDQRQQSAALAYSGIPHTTQFAFATGPLAELELTLDMEIVRGWFARLSIGPQVALLTVDGERRLHGGVFSAVGVVYAF